LKNIFELYCKHRPQGADRAIELARQRAAENAQRIHDATARSREVSSRVMQRRIDAAEGIASLF